MSVQIAALYVDERGPYVGLPGVDIWGITRDARLYPGPHPVVAHPPCERWGRYATGGPSAHGRYLKGNDGGCFVSALAAVRRWGGVLEHPADSSAWAAYGLHRPPVAGGWVPADTYGGWTCRVDQAHFGHKARKATWLYACSSWLPELPWVRAEADYLMGGHSKARRAERMDFRPELPRRERLITPGPFRDLLITIAKNSRRTMDTTVSISPAVRQSLTAEASEVLEAMALLGSFEILSEADYTFAGTLLRSVKERWKALEEKRTAVTGPLNVALKQVNGWFKPVQDPLKAAELALKTKVSTYILAQRAAAAATMQAAAAAVQAGDAAQAAEHVAALAPPAAVAGVSIKEVWDFEIIDAAAVPREYLSVDEQKVRAAIWYADTEKTAPRPIPGLRFFLKGQVTVRT